MIPVIRAPDLQRTLADYTVRLGFACRQHIPGVFALVEHGTLVLQVWACNAPAGRWEKPDAQATAFAPAHHSIAVHHIHALRASLMCAALRAGPPARPSAGITEPGLQPWGAWEFSFQDINGHVVHCVDWSVHTQRQTDPLPGADGHGAGA